MSNNMINLIGWILFIISAIGFCIASIGSFWAMFGSVFFDRLYGFSNPVLSPLDSLS